VRQGSASAPPKGPRGGQRRISGSCNPTREGRDSPSVPSQFDPSWHVIEALAVARGIDDAEWRAEALAEIAQWLSAEEQPSVLREALSTARAVDYAVRLALLPDDGPTGGFFGADGRLPL
jgi:hypothetical protein